MFTLSPYTALVTGAGAGIGRATSIAFSRAGARVIATDKDVNSLASLASEYPEIICHELDVTVSEQIDSIGNLIGDVDILFNCAGLVPAGSILDGDRASWQRAFDVNVTSVWLMTRHFLPGMIKKGSGNIINVASVVSTIKTAPNRCTYAATKAAVIALTKSVALDHVADGIRCNAVCPGTVDTPSLVQRMAATGDEISARRNFVARQPMGRLATAEEIAAAALYLASPESAFMTGHALVIDGAFSL
jgi:2-keto-3-deoxy-L-fuconate dehydrogenase